MRSLLFLLMLLSVKIVLAFSCIALAAGIGVAVAAIWALADKSTLIFYTRELTSGQGDLVGVYMTLVCPIVFGLVAVLPFILSVLAAVTSSDAKFTIYIKAIVGILFIIILVESPFIIAPMAMNIYVTPTNLKSALINSMNADYRGLPYSWSENRYLSLIWDKIMIANQCCGVMGITDFTTYYGTRASTWYSSYRSYIMSNGTTYTKDSVKIPISCCLLSSTSVLTNEDYYNIQSYIVNELCPINLVSTYSSSGCYEVIFTKISTFTVAFFVVQLLMVGCFIAQLVAALYIDCYNPQDEIGSSWKPSQIISSRKVEPVREYNQFNRYNDGYSQQPGIQTNPIYYNR